jgi:hypothetical protein
LLEITHGREQVTAGVGLKRDTFVAFDNLSHTESAILEPYQNFQCFHCVLVVILWQLSVDAGIHYIKRENYRDVTQVKKAIQSDYYRLKSRQSRRLF